jgi:hypothetical protein
MPDSLTIRGYCCLFGADSEPGPDGSRLRVLPGAFRLAGAITPLLFGHLQGCRPYASTLDRSLRLWESSFGLQFEADLEPTRAGYGLAGGIRSGTYCAVSCLYPADRTSRIETIAGERIEIVSRTRIEEVSIVPQGACPGAVAWLADQPIENMPPAIRLSAALWQPRPATERRPVATSRGRPGLPPAALLARIDRLLASATRVHLRMGCGGHP